jgi:WhiB family redox-sensing transcriptional regulator
MEWLRDAACRDEDPELFFPVGTSGPALLQIQEAKAVCRRCPVNAECLNWALAAGEDFGVWGAMSDGERRELARRNAPSRPTVAPVAETCAGKAKHRRTPGNTRIDPDGRKRCRDCEQDKKPARTGRSNARLARRSA